MNAMDKLFKLLLAAAAALFFTGCYSDYLNPGPARVYTRADFEAKGLEYISVGELKARFRAENAGMNDGTVASWTVDEPLFTSGKVISTDRFGNVYKSVYLYDEASESAIELKLNTGNYLFHPVGQIVYVDLEGLVLGNYRGMVSIGTTSYNASYSNDNIESKIMQDEHIFSGEQQPMLKSDTLVVTRDNYRTVLSDDDLGRLVRFEGVESRFGTALWGYKNTFPNYFANSVSTDVNSPGGRISTSGLPGRRCACCPVRMPTRFSTARPGSPTMRRPPVPARMPLRVTMWCVRAVTASSATTKSPYPVRSLT